MAKDRFLPGSFAALGRRLVFSVGIAFLTTTAGVRLICFDGITDRLVPLFAVGAFTAFTLSPTGMVGHSLKVHRGAEQLSLMQRIQWRMLINAVGAIAIGVALMVIVVAKLIEGRG